MKKSLLTESEIRKFMKFANITPLTENFLDRVTEENIEEDAIAEDTVTEDTVTEDTVTEEVLGEAEVDPEEFVRDLVDIISQHTNVDITVSGAEGGEEGEVLPGEEEEDVELGDTPPGLEEPGLEEPGEVELGEPLPGEEDDESGQVVEVEDRLVAENIVQEVTRRVAARLLKENKK